MKKLIIALFIFISLFWFSKSVWAVTYWWSSTYNMPYINSYTWDTLYYNANNTFYFTAWSWTTSEAEWTTADAIRVWSWFSLSGVLYSYAWCNISCGSWGPYTIVRVSYDSWTSNLNFRFYAEQFTSWFTSADIDESNITMQLHVHLTHPLEESCSWGSWDCELIIHNFYWGSSAWVKLFQINLNFYNMSDWTFWALHWTPPGTGWYIIDPNFDHNFNPDDMYGWRENWTWVTRVNYYRFPYSLEYTHDMNSMFLYLNSTTAPLSFANSMPIWLSSSWSSEIIVEWTWGTWGTWSIFTDCSSFLDIWCYIWHIWDSITWFFSNLFPEISFSWSYNSCWSWWTSSWSYIQRLWNFIALLNPIPPESWTNICTLFSTWQIITYQRATASWNFFTVYASGAWLPSVLYSNWDILFWQTFFDLIVIVTMILLVFYKRKND